uniref:Glycosyltransferase n=1 Tax=Thermosphaera aggregans TaxID=54254 RepID=A0A7C2BKH8_9CREN
MEQARREYDLVIDTESNMPLPADMVYMHFPAILERVERSGVQWMLYNKLVELLTKRLTVPRAGKVFANPTWTTHMVYRAYRVIADVFHPPVDVEYYGEVSTNEKRERQVVVISRFTPEKGLEHVLNVAERMPDYRFIIIGSTQPSSGEVLNKLNTMIDELKLVNVELKLNASREELRGMLRDAMFYLHPPYPEHFGISIVEAMSAGLIPIVYRDGGAWYDVVSKVSSMLGYSDIDSVPGIIKKFENNKELYIKLKNKSIEVSSTFTYESFRKNLVEKINYMLRVKKLS